MTDNPTQHRLAAVLVADVVGYSRLMEQDESGTMALLKARRSKVLQPLVRRHSGRVFKTTGDGVLIEFNSAVNSVQCAIDLQRAMAAANNDLLPEKGIVLRIGINLGDVIVEGSDLYGDGVNVAARLESLAEPGGICISRSVYDQVKRRAELSFNDLGSQTVKNLSELVHAYEVRTDQDGKLETAVTNQPSLALPAKPSIAVLPFTNMSSDPEQEWFVDGLTEDLITDLSRNAGLFVIARNSSFAYKGKSVDVRRIAKELGVRFLLEGSARRSGGRVRINVQLIDAMSGEHRWAERFDRTLEDIFAVQDEVTGRIVEALIGRLTVTAAPRQRPKNLEAYDLCVRARILMDELPHAAREADLLLHRAVDLDPEYAEAHRWLAMNYWMRWAHWGEPIEPNKSLALSVAEKAVALDPTDAGCRWVLGNILSFERRFSESDAEYSAALRLDPNNADAWADLSDKSVLSGRVEEGLKQIQRAFRLNPYPASWDHLFLGQAQYAAGNYLAAIETLRNEATYRTSSRRFLAASLAQLGRSDEAYREVEMFLVSNPNFTISHWATSQPFREDGTLKHFVDGFRKAGLPD